ncbi:GNAT family N-acetyltransferase [Streptomyces sp. DSM 44915]|uniref:GNAT family N-acetyltransferase n=1 Tax=Streptomyces chisholmiae TaxID=3075540 RepID=A0ABU2JQ08_9ACTN|nr:GNAT family N-acetyltransferase [Streptomyces sp. DSM 44915]MDT0267071.1 GNAT family N-acetyltransferase [Streptomyces sp. DSM 44915]
MDIVLRPATSADVPEIVAMLADDPLGATRENPAEPAPYRAAFARLTAEPNQHLLVAEEDGQIVGTLQLAILFGLSRQGASRALVEAVRVRADRRGTGLGGWLIRQAIERARREGCALVQLTSDASRRDAHRFYERLGFQPTHVGYKLPL